MFWTSCGTLKPQFQSNYGLPALLDVYVKVINHLSEVPGLNCRIFKKTLILCVFMIFYQHLGFLSRRGLIYPNASVLSVTRIALHQISTLVTIWYWYIQFKVGLNLTNVQKSPFLAILAYSACHYPPRGMPNF